MSSITGWNLKRLNEIAIRVKNLASKLLISSIFIPNPFRLVDRMVARAGGYLAGNLGSARMDFRFFALGGSGDLGFLASAQESQQIMDLIEQRWHDLVGYMPVKIIFKL